MKAAETLNYSKDKKKKLEKKKTIDKIEKRVSIIVSSWPQA